MDRIRHPFLSNGLVYQEGEVPVYDRPQDDYGNNYVVGRSSQINTEGDVRSVFTVESNPINPRELEEMRAWYLSRTSINHNDNGVDKITNNITLNNYQSGEYIQVLISFIYMRDESYNKFIAKKIAKGELTRMADVPSVRSQYQQVHRQSISDAREQLVQVVEDLGGVLHNEAVSSSNLPVERFWVPYDALQHIASLEIVSSISKVYEGTEDQAFLNNLVVNETLQLQQFNDPGYNLGNPSLYPHFPYDGEGTKEPEEWENIKVSIVEFCELKFDHKAFFDDSTLTNNRIKKRFSCGFNSCSENLNLSPISPQRHGTAVAGVLMADLNDSQDSAITNPTLRWQQMGLAPEVIAHYYDVEDLPNHTCPDGDSNSLTGTLAAYDHIIGSTFGSEIVNLSHSMVVFDINGNYKENATCDGSEPESIIVNEMFDHGIFVVATAGNEGHSFSVPAGPNHEGKLCHVGPRGSAITAFTVGFTDRSFGGKEDTKELPIALQSSRGGLDPNSLTVEGRGRTIVDIVAPGGRRVLDSDGTYDAEVTGSSYSAPAVAAAAADFMDHFKIEWSPGIGNPAYLKVFMLLMGDREYENRPINGTKLSTGYDGLWGAGRLRMRKFDANGMDSPWAFGYGLTCLKNGQQLNIPIYNGKIPQGADNLKAVMWVYDRDHMEKNATLDYITLRVQDKANGNFLAMDSTLDTKKRVFVSNIENKELELVISGMIVSDNSAFSNVQQDLCQGTDDVAVYYAWYFEDNARDDADGPYPNDIAPD